MLNNGIDDPSKVYEMVNTFSKDERLFKNTLILGASARELFFCRVKRKMDAPNLLMHDFL